MKKLKAYRGTNLNEAVRIMNQKMPRKYLYRITDKSEADGHASVHKYDHDNEAAAVLEAEIQVPKSVLREISHEEFQTLHQNRFKRVKDKVAVYDVWKFSLILVSPTQAKRIKQARIVEVM